MKLVPPEMNQRVRVVLENGRELSSRIEGIEGQELLLAAPADNGVVFLLRIDEPVMLHWITERGLLQGRCRVTGRVQTGVPLVRVELGEISVLQRRDAVRVECALTIEVHKDGESFSGTTLDLSGTGARVALDLDLREEEVVEAALYTGDGDPIEGRAVVVRAGADNVFALQFTLDRRDQERLMRYVFAEHRREFAAVRRGAD